MADYLKLGEVLLNSGDIQIVKDGLEFEEPRQRVTRQDYLLDHGGKVTDRYYENAIRRIKLKIIGASKEAILASINTIIAELIKASNVLAFQPDGATDMSYSDVLGASISSTSYDWFFSKRNTAYMNLELECKPFWRADVVTLPINLVKDGRLNINDSGDGVANSWSLVNSGTFTVTRSIQNNDFQRIAVTASTTTGYASIKQQIFGLSVGDVISFAAQYKCTAPTGTSNYDIYLYFTGAGVTTTLLASKTSALGEFQTIVYENYIVPAGTTEVWFYFRVQMLTIGDTGTLDVKKTMIVKDTQIPGSYYDEQYDPKNLLKNSALNADDDLDGVANYWAITTTGTVTHTDSIEDNAQKIVASSTVAGYVSLRQTQVLSLVDIKPGDVVSLAVKYKCLAPTAGGHYDLSCTFYAQDGTQVGSTQYMLQGGTTAQTAFVIVSKEGYTVPADAYKVRMSLIVDMNTAGDGGTIWLKEAMIVKASTLPDWYESWIYNPSWYESSFIPPATIDVPDMPGDVEALTQIDVKTEGATSLAKIRVGKKTDENINYLENFEGILETDDLTLETNVTQVTSNTARNYDYASIASANISASSSSPTSYVRKSLEVSKYKGKYRLFARVKCSAAFAVYFRAYTAATTSASKKTNSFVSHNTATWVYLDLGEIDIPHIEISSISQIDWIVGIQIYRGADAIDAWLDYLILLPIDEGWGVQSDTIIQNDHHVQDSLTDDEQVYLIKSTLLTSGSALKDYTNKIASSISECPHIARKQDSTTTSPSKTSGAEYVQDDYDRVEANDASNFTHTTTPSTGGDTDITTPSTPVTSSPYSDTNPTCTVDNDTSAGNYTSLTPPAWCQWDLGSIQAISRFRILYSSTSPSWSLTGLKYSTDGSTWYDVPSISPALPYTITQNTWFQFDFTIVNARYLKLECSSGNYPFITEIEIRLAGSYYPSPTYSEDIYEIDISNINISDITKLTPLMECYGSGNGGNGVTVKIWNNSTSAWDSVGSNTAAATTDVTSNITTNMGNYIDASNKLYVLVYSTNPSTSPAATTNASVITDYAKLTVEYIQATESGIANYVGDVVKLSPGDNRLVVMFEQASKASSITDDAEITLKFKSRHLNYL